MTFPALCVFLLVLPPQPPLPVSSSVSPTTGGIKANIQSSGGVPVAGVQVRLKHRDGRVWGTLTDGQGRFMAGGLPPGEYWMESSLAGFKGESCAIQIKAQAWLLGVPVGPRAYEKPGLRALHFQGPATYEIPGGLIRPQQRPELGKIPMH